jgi:uncharacterized protein
MEPESKKFDEQKALKELKRYLPSQGPLKDFVHHNTLHAFQNLKFEEGCQLASSIFGYKVFLTIGEYRELYREGRIRKDILEDRIIRRVGSESAREWLNKLLHTAYHISHSSRIGLLRKDWKKEYDIDLDAEVHKNLFRILNSYLDQGISTWKFPYNGEGLISSLRELEINSFIGFLRTPRSKALLQEPETSIELLLGILVGDEDLFEQYLFDQQFAHPGWSGMAVYIEQRPESLLDKRKITLKDVIILDLILEIDALDNRFGENWKPLGQSISKRPRGIFDQIQRSERIKVVSLWQEAFEWSYYDQALAGMQLAVRDTVKGGKSFQALFCIDDRECSIRRHIENLDKSCETFGTPGYFGIECYYQPEQGHFYTKVCPPPITPKHLIKEQSKEFRLDKDIHFSRKTHHPVFGFFLSVVGFFSFFRLFINIFKPSLSPAASLSFSHMGRDSFLIVENKDPGNQQDGLQIGFTIDEMAERVEKVLKAIGLVEEFGDIVYVFGHGSSSINNTHYAAYDCGACSGRPGSVNARAFAFMANHPEVRRKLREKEDVFITDRTQFLGALHDTTRDEFIFYDEASLSDKNADLHKKNLETFRLALDMNAKERSRRFFSIDSRQSPERIHQEIRNRSVSLFEPRPELNHATNALCIVGRRSLHEHLFLDRRAFFNSYDYRYDPGGRLLLHILAAAVPVCGGINLEYYFSRVDNQKLGAGSKLPHNVMGLIGVSNGIEGDLRTGLPFQMIDMHDPLRLLMIIEHYPQVILKTISKEPAIYEWFKNEWINLSVIHPDTFEILVFRNEEFIPYKPLTSSLETADDINLLLESGEQSFPVYLIKK